MGRITLRIDNTQLTDYCMCPRYWYYKYIKGLAPIGVPKRAPLERGTLVHLLLDYYYKRVNEFGWAGAWEQTHNCFEDLAKRVQLQNGDKDLIRSRIRDYAMKYRNTDFTPMIFAEKPQVEIGFTHPIVDTAAHLLVLEGRIDLITNQGIFVDHKTQQQARDHCEYDTQFMCYCLATGLNQVIVNYIVLSQQFDPERTFRRPVYSYTKPVLQKFEQWLKRKMFEMVGCLQSGYFETDFSKCGGPYKVGPPCEYSELSHALTDTQEDQFMRAHYQVIEPWQPWTIQELQQTEKEIHK